jgi:hypothetical protein
MINNTLGQYEFTSKCTTAFPDGLNSIDIAFVGECVDERGTDTLKLLQNTVQSVKSLRFDAKTQQTYLEGTEILREGLKQILQTASRIMLDATTLGLGEIIQILLAASRSGTKNLEFLYAEPRSYSRSDANIPANRKMRDYQLTENCQFSAIQGFAHQYDASMEASHVFFLGFEPWRVQNAIEQRGDIDWARYHCHAIIGIPAFRTGWESNSIVPHIPVFTDIEVSSNSTTYCQANSIRESYLTLWNLYKRMGNERGCFFVSPLGTKPHTVGAALFLFETKGNDIPTSLYYDHPIRVQNRTTEVSAWHHVQVNFGT